MYVCVHGCLRVCMAVCLCMHVCVCMNVCMAVHVHIILYSTKNSGRVNLGISCFRVLMKKTLANLQ